MKLRLAIVLSFVCASAFAQLPANWFVRHPTGDRETVACVHLVAAHANDTVTGPCVHRVQQHPGGHDTGVRDLRGRAVIAECPHMVPQHGSDSATVPCTHVGPQHAGGDTAYRPCIHPMPVVREAAGIKFYTNDPNIQAAAIAGAQKLRDLLGEDRLTNLRALNVFHHAPTAGDDMWFQYDGVSHSIQLQGGNSNADTIEQLRHELGHAIVGHSCVKIMTMGGSHSVCGTEPSRGAAMSEGWADFVGLVLQNARTDSSLTFYDVEWENSHSNPDCPLGTNTEYRVGATLWDLFDEVRDGVDTIALSFRQLYSIMDSSLATASDGPAIVTLDDYLRRLRKNNPNQRRVITRVRRQNVDAP